MAMPACGVRGWARSRTAQYRAMDWGGELTGGRLPAPDDALQQGSAVAGHPARFVPHVLGMVVAQHRLDPLEAVPVEVGRILALHHDLPFASWAAGGDQLAAHVVPVAGPGSAVDECSGIGRVFEDITEHAGGRRPPGHLAEAVAPWHGELTALEAFHHLGDRALLEKGGEDQGEAVLYLPAGVLGDTAVRITLETGRQRQPQLAAGSLAQQTGGETTAQQVQLDLGHGTRCHRTFAA